MRRIWHECMTEIWLMLDFRTPNLNNLRGVLTLFLTWSVAGFSPDCFCIWFGVCLYVCHDCFRFCYVSRILHSLFGKKINCILVLLSPVDSIGAHGVVVKRCGVTDAVLLEVEQIDICDPNTSYWYFFGKLIDSTVCSKNGKEKSCFTNLCTSEMTISDVSIGAIVLCSPTVLHSYVTLIFRILSRVFLMGAKWSRCQWLWVP